MPRSPMASRTSSSLKGLMMARTSFMDFCADRAVAPQPRDFEPARADCARSRGPDQVQTDRQKDSPRAGIGSVSRSALAQQSFLGDRGDQRAVAGKDQSPRQTARTGKVGA